MKSAKGMHKNKQLMPLRHEFSRLTGSKSPSTVLRMIDMANHLFTASLQHRAKSPELSRSLNKLPRAKAHGILSTRLDSCFTHGLKSVGFEEEFNKSKRSFTLIELLLTMVILGGIASIVIIKYPSSLQKTRDVQRMNDLKTYQTALEVWAGKNSGIYPTTAPSTPINVTTLCSQLDISSTSCPSDPKGWIYSYETDSAGIKYTISSQMEKEASNYVVCSSGKSGNTTSAPSDGTCPTFVVD